jgi:hypothetical protein
MKDFGIQLIDSFDQGTPLDLKIDVKKDIDGKIISGISLGNTLNQNKALILMMEPGENKAHPTMGVGFTSVLNGDNEDLLATRHSVRRNFNLDGLTITELELYDLSNIKINGKYE